MPRRRPLVPEQFRLGDREISTWAAEVTRGIPLVRVETLNPSSVSANSESAQTFTVSGLKTADIIQVEKPSHTSNLSVMQARVSADDTLQIVFRNFSGSPIDPPSEDYRIVIVR